MRATALAAMLAIAGLATAHTADAATLIQFDSLSGAEYDTAGVFVTGVLSFTATDDDGSGYDSVDLNIWDDGSLKFSQTYSLSVGTSGAFAFSTSYPGLVGTGAPGIGIDVSDAGNTVISLDPYYLPHYSDPDACQVDCGPVTPTVPLPAGAGLLLMAGLALLPFRRKRS